jgi:hypothetical protein
MRGRADDDGVLPDGGVVPIDTASLWERTVP